ncbi:MAG: class I SAM-dependent methyltransferase [Phycisphaerae bacterium]|nr:class I SAM-dependent methyltransferase [Phycisphaerae bacterium]
MLSKIRNLSALYRSKGFAATRNYVWERVASAWNERHLGIETTRIVEKAEMNIDNAEFAHYIPMTFGSLRRCLARVTIRPDEDVFIDYGCGKGRIVVVAATMPFRRVLGVEISPQLAKIAERNVSSAARRLACRDVRIIVHDATTYEVPDELTFAFFFNPFTEGLFSQVLARLRESLDRRPRRFTLIYGNANDGVRQLLHATPWLIPREEYFDWAMPATWSRMMILENKTN